MIKNYFFILFLYFVFSTFFILIIKSQRQQQNNFISAETCKEARELPLIGKANIQDYCGRVLLLIFISPKQCNSECNNILNQLNSINEQFNDVRVMAVMSKINENEINLFIQKYSKIRFEIENKSSKVWNWFRANHLEQFIFDRCSRNTAKLFPTTPFSSTIYALQSTLSTQPCGRCDYDSSKPAPKWPSLHPPPKSLENKERGQFTRVEGTPNVRPSNVVPPRNSAFVNNNASLTSFGRQQRMRNSTEKILQKKQQQKHQQIIKTTSKPSEQQNSKDYNNLIRQKHLELQERERLIREREDRQRQNEEKQRKYWLEQQQKLQQQHQQIYTTPTISPLNQQRETQNMVKQKKTHQPSEITRSSINYANEHYKNKNYFSRGEERRREQQQQQTNNQEKNKILSNSLKYSPQVSISSINQRIPIISQQKLTINNVEPAPLYPENNNDENTQDYYNYDEIWTTESSPQNLQIPKPITTKLEPTQPSFSSSSSSIQQQQENNNNNNKNTNFGFELPCTGFTDESCFQQQTQLRQNEIHRCCRGRILFSDICISGKCSNTTIQLCCIQRFLQAKFACCSDERLSIIPTGDHFSRCCFDNFVESDDNCCPREYASEQWRSVHELCLPNVEIDLSEVKVPVPLAGTSLITEFDFGKTDRWRFECRYGAHTRQFSYFEQSASQEKEDNSEEKSEEIKKKKR